ACSRKREGPAYRVSGARREYPIVLWHAGVDNTVGRQQRRDQGNGIRWPGIAQTKGNGDRFAGVNCSLAWQAGFGCKRRPAGNREHWLVARVVNDQSEVLIQSIGISGDTI